MAASKISGLILAVFIRSQSYDFDAITHAGLKLHLGFFNIRSVAKFQKIEEGSFGVFKKFSKKVSKPKRGEKTHNAEKVKKDLSDWECFQEKLALTHRFKTRTLCAEKQASYH